MISLICTTEPTRIPWLPQFVRHYRALGVERFFLSLQIEPDLKPGLRQEYRAQFRQMLAALGIDEAFFLEKSFDAFAIRDHHDAIQDAHISPDDWIVWCDSDEFQRYPLPLAQLIARWRGNEIAYVDGLLIDRVAGDGSLPRFDPMKSVWEQFPVTCFFAQGIGQVLPKKVAIGRGDVYLSTGNHYLAREAPMLTTPAAAQRVVAAGSAELKNPGVWVQIHHFKWDESVFDRLRFRLSPQWRAKCSWWEESDRLLNYLERNGGRFNLADLNIFTPPDDRLMLLGTRDKEQADKAN